MNDKKNAQFISDPINIRYLTGFMGLAPEERESYAVILHDCVYLYTSSLYKEQASKLTLPRRQAGNSPIIQSANWRTNKPIIVSAFSREKPIEKILNEILSKNNIKNMEFEKYDITVAEYEKLQKELPGITLIPTFGNIEKIRMIKTPEEIQTIRRACTLTDECFTHLLAYIKEGQTESEIAWEIESFFHTHGASSSFSPIVAFNEHASEPHYSPNSCSRGPLAKQEDLLCKPSLILLDFGAKVDGYCADMTRVVFLGKPKVEWVKAYETVLQAQTKALLYLCHSRESGNPDKNEAGSPIPPSSASWLTTKGRGKSGMTTRLSGAKADVLAKKTITDAGYPAYPHGLGHGVGLAIHEAPRLSVSRDEPLLTGNVFSIEPGIYLEGKYGIRIEDLVVLTDTGAETISKSEKGLTIL